MMPCLAIPMHEFFTIVYLQCCSQYKQVSKDHSTPCFPVTTAKESEMIPNMTLAVGLVITMVLQQANGQCESNYYSTVFLYLLDIN